MTHRFAEIAFTDNVRALQSSRGSRAAYAAMDKGEARNHRLSERETAFIGARDSFYIASVSETGWPYVQHRGGAVGFMRVLDNRRLGFADFRGNRQYVSAGNFMNNNRVALLFMDYPNRQRLKLLGHIRQIGPEDSQLLQTLTVANYRGRIERGFVIEVEAFDWNCPQHITPRFTQAQMHELAEGGNL